METGLREDGSLEGMTTREHGRPAPGDVDGRRTVGALNADQPERESEESTERGRRGGEE